jgi:hypothetical protein
VLVEQVDVVGPEPLQGSVHDFPDVPGAAVEPHLLAVRDMEPELGGAPLKNAGKTGCFSADRV